MRDFGSGEADFEDGKTRWVVERGSALMKPIMTKNLRANTQWVFEPAGA